MRAFPLLLPCLVMSLAVAPASAGADVAVAAGTLITNTATATYGSTAANPAQFSIASNPVVTTVAAVSAVTVGPSESACNVANDSVDNTHPFVKTFTVNNTSNVRDAYSASATTSAGTLLSIVATAPNGTQTTVQSGAELPAVDAGSMLRVAVTVDAKSLALGTSIQVSLGVRSSAAGAANGQASATATQCAITAGAAAFTGLTTPAIPKLVNGVVSVATQPGGSLSYSMSFHNAGGVAAQNAVLTDPVPDGITPLPATVTIGGGHAAASLSGNTLTVPLGTLAPAASVTIAFGATVSNTVALGTSLVNVASIAADNVAKLTTNPASVIAGYDNVVYDGYEGQALPVPSAVVTLIDPATNQPVDTHAAAALRAGEANARGAAPQSATHTASVTTPTDGTYTIGVTLNHKRAHYILAIAAPNYRSRRIDVVLTPDTTNTLYSATLTALDGQLLALPGDFKLVPGPVKLVEVYGVFGNLPLFRNQILTISKTVDRQVASAGDRLEYTIAYANVGIGLGATSLVDVLPPGLTYAPGTSRLDGHSLEPMQSGRRLTWQFKELSTSHTLTLAAVVAPGVADNTTLTNVATIESGTPNVVAGSLSASATAATTIVAGIFSDRTVVTGRVYIDAHDRGSFERGDAGVPLVRLFLETGESVLTDGDGRFSFPGVKPGMHVLRLDTATLPLGVRSSGDRAYDSERSPRRLIHGVFDGGVMQDVNFALEGGR